MSQKFNRAFIVGTGSFLPGEPIPNDRLDEILGPLNGASKRVQSFVKNIASRMLDSSGVEYRHFAIDPKTHQLTHTIASLGEEAARRALDAAGKKPEDIELLLLSCPNYDYATPPTSTLLQERLGIECCAEMEIHSNCAGVGKCMQVAFDALRCGRYKTALVVYSQLSSTYLRDSYFNQMRMNKSQAVLRYILADGSGAVVLETAPESDVPVAHELIGTYVESVGAKRPPGMTAGNGAADMIDTVSPVIAIYERGTHHLDQDFAAVNRYAGKLLLEGLIRMIEVINLDPKQIDHVIISIPTRQLFEDNTKQFMEYFDSVDKRIKFRAAHTGYCGGASVLLHLDEMVRSGEIKQGEMVIIDSVESSKWMTAGFAVRW